MNTDFAAIDTFDSRESIISTQAETNPLVEALKKLLIDSADEMTFKEEKEILDRASKPDADSRSLAMSTTYGTITDITHILPFRWYASGISESSDKVYGLGCISGINTDLLMEIPELMDADPELAECVKYNIDAQNKTLEWYKKNK